MVSIAQLGYLGLSVSDLDGWERFAQEILGLQSNGRNPDGSLSLRMDEYYQRFILYPNGDDDLAYYGWEVTDGKELQALAAQLEAAGVEVRAGTEDESRARRVVELIKFKDPNGVASEAFYGPLQSFERPFKSPRPISGFVTGTMGLGHTILMVDNLERSIEFYRDVLGMRLSDFVDLDLGGKRINIPFFHCNRRHHTIALIAPPKPRKRLNHIMLQLKSLDDVGATYYLCQERSVPLVMTLGRHTNDHMVSFYLRTPSGFAIEYGWGAREVDDRIWHVQSHRAGSIWGHIPASQEGLL